MKKTIPENELIQKEAQEILSNIDFMDPDQINQYDKTINTLEKYRDLLVDKYRERITKTTLRGMHIEDKASSFFNVPKINQIIENLARRQTLFREAEKNVDTIYEVNNQHIDLEGINVIYKDEVITPPDHRGIKFNSDTAYEYSEQIKFQPRLQKILYLLKLKGIKKENIEIRIGKTEKNMMRKITYVSIYLKGLEKIIYVCDQANNLTFLFNKDKKLEVDYYDSLTKDEKREFLEKNKKSGIYVQYSQNWLKIIEDFLLQGDKDIEFKMGDLEKKKELVREILEKEAVVEIIKTIKGVRKLLWKSTIATNRSYQEYKTILSILCGQSLEVSGGLYDTVEKVIPAIRKLYKGLYDSEKFINKDIEFEVRKNFSKKTMVRKLLEKEGVIELQKGENNSTVLVWKKSIDAHKAYQGFTKLLQNLLGNIYKVHGGENFRHFDDTMRIIRDLYQGKYDSERFDNKNLEFEMSSLDHKKEMLKNLLEDQNVIKFKTNEKGEKALIWENTITPKLAYQGFVKHVETLLGNITGVNGQLHYNSFKSIIPVIREIFKDLYDKEEYGNKDIEFTMGNLEHRKQMIRNLLEDEGILEIKNDDDEKTLVWIKKIQPDESYQGFTTRLNILLGKIEGIDGGIKYKSFKSVISSIQDLYQGLYDKEDYQDKEIQFKVVNSNQKKEMVLELLENEGVLKIIANEENEKVLVWKGTINPHLNYQDYTSVLNILMGNITAVNGTSTYKSFQDVVDFIRKACSNFYDKEDYGTKDIEFEMGNVEQKKQILQNLLESENIIEFQKDDDHTVLIWKNKINPRSIYQGFTLRLSTLFAHVFGKKEYNKRKNIITAIRKLYQGKYNQEKFTRKDTEFLYKKTTQKKNKTIKKTIQGEKNIKFTKQQLGNREELDNQKTLLRKLFIDEGVFEIKENEKKERVLVWKKTINPQLIYQGYKIKLNTMLGYVMGVDGFIEYLSYKSLIPPIRNLFKGLYDKEQYGNKDIEFTMENSEHKKTIIRNILEAEGIIEFRKIDNDKTVLIWKKTVNPQSAYQGFVSRFATLFGNIMNVNGIKTYQSFKSLVPIIKVIFKDSFSQEEYGNKDIEFTMENLENKKTIIRNILEAENIIEIVKKNKKDTLIWKDTITPGKSYQGFETRLKVLLSGVTKLGTSREFISFHSIIPVIRELYKDFYTKEKYGNKDIEFEMKGTGPKKTMMRKLLIDEGVVKLRENDKNEKLLVWVKTINPRLSYQGFNNHLSTLFGNIHKINGKKAYKNIKSMIPAIRDIFSDLYDKETYQDKDIEFEMADTKYKKEMVKNLLENEDVIELKTDEKEEKILVWKKTIDTHKAHQGFNKFLQILIGNIFQVNGAALYKSYESIIPAIREIYKDLYTKEEYGNKDIEFEMEDMDNKKRLVKEILEDEGVVEIEENDDKRILVWKSTINERKSYKSFRKNLNILLGNITGVGGGDKYKSFASIIPAIKEVYNGMYDEERWEIDKK